MIQCDSNGKYPITDEQSFTRFYQQYHKFAYKIAYSFMGCKETAKDIIQQVFLDIWLNKHTIDPLKDVLSFVFICTRNRSIGILEQQRRHDKAMQDFLRGKRLYIDPMKEIEARQIYMRVKQNAVKKLPRQSRLVYQMIIEEDECYLDVAKAMQLSPSTVKNQKINARRKLQEFIGREVLATSN